MRSKNFFLPVFFQFKMHRKCIFCAYTDRKADIHPFSYAKTNLDYPNLKTYRSGKQIKYKQKESKIPNSITQRKKLYPTIEFSKPKNPQRTCLRLGVQTVNFTREQGTGNLTIMQPIFIISSFIYLHGVYLLPL